MPHHVPIITSPRPLLVEGEHLDQSTFHARYEAMSPGTWAELIGGVVFMPSPVGRAHGHAQFTAAAWLSYYVENTPGVEGLDHATAVLGSKSEAQPDLLLRILPECGGQTRTEHGYVRGGPELVVEITQAPRYVDLGPKLDEHE